MSDKAHVFHLKVDGGEAREFTSRHSIYARAVMEAFGKIGLPYPCTVEIWVPALVPEYGPYFFRIDDFRDMRGDQYVVPSIMTASDAGEPISLPIPQK